MFLLDVIVNPLFLLFYPPVTAIVGIGLAAIIILAVIIPVLPMNIFLLALTQRNINAIYAKEERF